MSIQRTIQESRKAGRITAIVERYIPRVRIKSDAFGFGDLLSIDPQRKEIILVQVCSAGSRLAHLRKIGAEPQRSKALAWLRAGGRIELWCWSLRKVKRGGKARRWYGQVFSITPESFQREAA